MRHKTRGITHWKSVETEKRENALKSIETDKREKRVEVNRDKRNALLVETDKRENAL